MALPVIFMKVVQQLALDEQRHFPLASGVVLQDFYIDECYLGRQTRENLKRLTNKVLGALKENVDSVKLWIDTSISLSWINISPHLLKTFDANRVSQIQQLSKDFQRRHISSECNFADTLSRGLDAKTLAACEPEPSCLDISTQDAV
ncbi:integrase_H2C2 domain-containing protein [Trichonephila clavata]|uniref:Integrase_H2C2 domain-containing protein n=1 Tax=Trichonephila clavata TaxID=2740835 RepID=A0A8X6LZR9_TRICU|nr:integrase_H2C2 domain-containing protein [Trichonephila clavata]